MNRIDRLNRVKEYFINQPNPGQETMWIPEAWNFYNLNILKKEHNELLIDPGYFYPAVIDGILHSGRQSSKETKPFSIEEANIYCSLIRYSTAWDVNHDGAIENGSFIRFLLLLPMLQALGINVLYMLPITTSSDLYKKGDTGSPFCVKDYLKIDPALHEVLLDGFADFTIEDELGALVEAAHLLGMKVVSDYIPRVVARNFSLLEDHPDWFYWICLDRLKDFAPPTVPGLGNFTECSYENLETVYQSQETKEHLKKFVLPPNEFSPQLWEEIKKEARETEEDILTLIEKKMGITTMPGHTDWINDDQPVWTDITFLKLYWDQNETTKKMISPNHPPYIMFDTIKANVFPGSRPNTKLWRLLKEVAVQYIQRFNFDGIRVDIGHSIPPQLLQDIFSSIREIKPDVILLSEHLFNRDHIKARDCGYQIMLGQTWLEMSRINKENLRTFLTDLEGLQLPVFGSVETPDTPRLVSRGDEKLVRMMLTFNHFLPSSAPFYTTGIEVIEEQPLNCGLADNTNGREIPRAFYNTMCIDWTNNRFAGTYQLLHRLNQLKTKYDLYYHTSMFNQLDLPGNIIGYSYTKSNGTFYFLFNLDLLEKTVVSLNNTSPSSTYTVLLDTEQQNIPDQTCTKKIELESCQALILTNL